MALSDLFRETFGRRYSSPLENKFCITRETRALIAHTCGSVLTLMEAPPCRKPPQNPPECSSSVISKGNFGGNWCAISSLSATPAHRHADPRLCRDSFPIWGTTERTHSRMLASETSRTTHRRGHQGNKIPLRHQVKRNLRPHHQSRWANEHLLLSVDNCRDLPTS